jgi:hypothetical protein
MWQEFLTSYAEDNPYSQEDEDLRGKANSQKNYWSSYQMPTNNEYYSKFDKLFGVNKRLTYDDIFVDLHYRTLFLKEFSLQ